ncbi:MAG: YdcF family protein [Candidatus Riflebacteria bacterium]|nr:YdcF family protein [Candidatus Riflebacteria bacterium]
MLLVLGAALLWTRYSSLGRRIVTLVVIFLFIAAIFPIGPWLLAPLETVFPAPKRPPEHIDGIITMGGVNPWLTGESGHPALNEDAECLTSVLPLARRFPDARIVYTGGLGSMVYGGISEASAAATFFAEQGLDLARFTWETGSRGTQEKARNTFDLVKPEASETWLLITSAWRMPRTYQVFHTVGWNVIPWPVDFHAADAKYLHFDIDDSLKWIWNALKEWIGLAAYRATGRSDSLFPVPPPR